MLMKLAVLRIRGRRKLNPKIRRTLEMLRLDRTNRCILVEDTPQNRGMLAVVKDYATYGPVSEDTVFALLYKRGRKGKNLLRAALKEGDIRKAAGEIFSGKKTIDYANPVFRLRPPTKGYRDIKAAYPHGELGKRDEMDSLLKRMI